MRKNSEKKNFFLNLVIILAVVIGSYAYFKPNSYQTMVAKWKDDEVKAEVYESLTTQLLNEAIIYDKADSGSKAIAKEEMQNTIVQRKEYTTQMMKDNPKAFLEGAISSDLKNDLFKEVDGIEKFTTIEGTLEIYCAVDEAGKVLYEAASVITRTGSVYQLHLADDSVLDKMTSGDTVKASGYVLEDSLVPDTLSNSNNFATITKAAALPNAKNSKVAIILVNFEGKTTHNLTKEQWKNSTLYLRDYFEEVSFGQLTISGKNYPLDAADVFGFYTIPAGTVACDYNSWRTAARNAAAKDGFNATGYNHIMYVTPGSGGCGWIGLATVGGVDSWYSGGYGSTSQSLQMRFDLSILPLFAHELGHNLGFGHARSASCKDSNSKATRVSDNCTYSEYGDIYDVMGDGGFGRYGGLHYSAWRKNIKGWISTSSITTVNKDGIYDVYPLENYSSNPQLLVVPITYKNASGANATWTYYIDFRTPSRFDTYPANHAATRGILVRNNTSTASSSTTNVYGGPVAIGETFNDPIRQVTFKVLSANDMKASVEVKLGTQTPGPEPCVRSNPNYTVSPLTGTANAGSGLVYTVSIKNNDSSSCASSTYDIVSDIPTGFTQNKSTASLTIVPGGTSSTTFTVTSGANSPGGDYPISFSVKELASGYSQILSSTFTVKSVVTPTCVRNNSTVSITPASLVGKPGEALTYNISVKNNDNSVCEASTYNIVANLPTDFTIDTNNISTSILPGATYTKAVKITSGSTLANGNYTIPFTVKSSSTSITEDASVIYTVSAPTCMRGEPTISMTPTSLSGKPGAALTYTISIKNNDSSACAASNYTIATTLPSGFTTDSNNISTSVNPGVTYTKAIKITSPTTAQNGNTTVQYTITNTSTGVAKTVSSVYTVTGAVTCKEGTPTISVSPTSTTGEIGVAQSYTLSIKNNDSGCPNKTYNIAASVPSGFKVDVSSASVTLASGASTTKVFKMTPGTGVTNGIYSLSISISEGTNRYSASGTYNVITYIAIPPTVNIIGLTNNQKLGNGNNNVTVSASHNKGIAEINIFLNNIKVASCTNPKKNECTYGVNASKIVVGSYVLKAEAIANDGVKTSNIKTIVFTR